MDFTPWTLRIEDERLMKSPGPHRLLRLNVENVIC